MSDIIGIDIKTLGECWSLVTCKKCGYKTPALDIRVETKLYLSVDKINFCPQCGASMRNHEINKQMDIFEKAVRVMARYWLPEYCMECSFKDECHTKKTEVSRRSEECINKVTKRFKRMVREHKDIRQMDVVERAVRIIIQYQHPSCMACPLNADCHYSYKKREVFQNSEECIKKATEWFKGKVAKEEGEKEELPTS